jgi:hypothetical protein
MSLKDLVHQEQLYNSLPGTFHMSLQTSCINVRLGANGTPVGLFRSVTSHMFFKLARLGK